MSRALLNTTGVLLLAFLCLPALIVIPMSFSSASSLEFPPPGFSLRWYDSFFGDPRWLLALQNSVIIALLASTIALVLGGIAAYGLVRGTFRGKPLIEGVFIAPLIVPAVVIAVALYLFFARLGVLGTMTGLVIGHTILGVPYVILVLSVAIRAFDARIEQVALSLGASSFTMLRRVLLPNLLPSAFAAWIFALIASFDEVIITYFIAGRYDTLPKRMFNELALQVNPTITAIATLLIAVSFVTMGLVALLLRRGGLGVEELT